MVKNPPANVGDIGSISGPGRSPGEGNSYPLQYSCWRISWTEEPGGLQSMGLKESKHTHTQSSRWEGTDTPKCNKQSENRCEASSNYIE